MQGHNWSHGLHHMPTGPLVGTWCCHMQCMPSWQTRNLKWLRIMPSRHLHGASWCNCLHPLPYGHILNHN
jgi:hypothetical protein